MKWNVLRSLISTTFMLPIILIGSSEAVTKPHVITFGKWTSVEWLPASTADQKPLSIKIRPLIVDGHIKEYVTGASHEVTERLFVVRRMFRLNDSLPEDSAPRWQWQRGGWLLVDRVTGRITPINLAEFDAVYSTATWYRDYVAYCGTSDDGKKVFAVVSQLNRRKPVLKKPLSTVLSDDAAPDSACCAPLWQRAPARVTFEPNGGSRETFVIRGHVADLVDDSEDE